VPTSTTSEGQPIQIDRNAKQRAFLMRVLSNAARERLKLTEPTRVCDLQTVASKRAGLVVPPTFHGTLAAEVPDGQT
jgi:hypothetical protein